MAGYTNLEYFKGTPRQRGTGLGALPGKIRKNSLSYFSEIYATYSKETWEKRNRGCSSGTGGSDCWKILDQEGN